MTTGKVKKVQNKNNESSSSSSSDELDMKGGGIMDILFGKDVSSYVTSLIFDAFQKKMPFVGLFVINHAIDNSIKIKYNCKDSDGRTLLHWLVMICSKIEEARVVLVKLLENTNMKKYINEVDKCKNTVGHYAVYLNQNDLVELFVKYGLDLSIKNDAGLKISAEEQYKQDKPNVFIRRDTKDLLQASDRIDKLVDKIVKATETDEDTINFNMNTVIDVSDANMERPNTNQVEKNKLMLNDILNAFAKINDSELDKMNSNLDVNILPEQNKKTEMSIVSEQNKKMQKSTKQVANNSVKSDNVMFGGNNSDNAFIVENIYNEFNGTSNDKIVNRIVGNYQKMNKIGMQQGGVITGSRKMTTYSEMSITGGASEDEENEEDDESSSTSTSSDEDEFDETEEETDDETNDETNSDESTLSGGELSSDECRELVGYANLARTNNEKDDHEIITKKIKENLKLKDDFEAKAYKAIIYKEIKDKNPNMKYDERTVELDKRASDKKYLTEVQKTIDPKKVTEIITYLKGKNTESDTKINAKKEKGNNENGSRKKMNLDPYTSD
ncbi:hypothetical protein BMW23_0450 [Bodo saltans virus]|uniref:Ankyrin repeat domain-containing protein n=1 Tax=Bodo saltans virus TaxID=2024608 RepID=A0A2H4UU94_9VIRU|nr:hypothetical protein QJ851_gp0439 [Bodo saltans virus]ATZ80502.1 hypothetical protein BMW23_0450 [Bodo saltans virus]